MVFGFDISKKHYMLKYPYHPNHVPVKQKLDLKSISDLLLNRGIIAAEQHRLILTKQHEQIKKLKKLAGLKGDQEQQTITPVDIIVSLNLYDQRADGAVLTEEVIMREIAAGLNIPFKKIDPLELDLEIVTRTVSRAFAIKNLTLPLGVENGQLVVATVDPLNKDVFEDIAAVQKLSVKPVISTKTDILKVIREFYGFKRSIVMAERELVAPLVDIGNLEQYAKLGTAEESETTTRYVQHAVDHLFRSAFEQRASDIHLEPKRERGIVRFRIDGILYTAYSMPLVVYQAVVSRIKSLSRMNIAEKRRPQDGRIKIVDENQNVEIRVSTVPVAFGEKVVLRLLKPEILFQDLEQLGFTPGDLIHYRSFLERPYGIILVTGPTGSGKTTTLYSSLKFLASPEKNITTIEDPIEMVCEDYNQIAVQPAVDITFSSILRNILRQDPDIIMIGEIRDQETARNAIQAALTGHLVLSTLHTNDAASAVTRLMDLGIEPFLISSTLIGAIAQRLVRTVCEHCSETVTLAPDELETLGIPLYSSVSGSIAMKRGTGCLQCRQTGFKGREGVFEVLRVTDSIKKLIDQKASSDIIKKTAQHEGMKTLLENAVLKILKGKTTYGEVLRCISHED
ncbi:MAG: GspE/PulE family protein [Desulfobacterota bacterium]|nr:GspE/PulE family protein [Thermodesulfobacteriota bacterium]